MSFILNPGTYSIKYVGKKQPGLDLDRAIGDFLVNKELVTTTDCCAYTLVGGAGGVTTNVISFNPISNLLTVTVNGIASTATILLDSGDILTNAAITVNNIVYPIGTSVTTILTALAAAPALPLVASMYNSDALAAAGLVALNTPYWAGAAHIEGAVHGTLKLRTV